MSVLPTTSGGLTTDARMTRHLSLTLFGSGFDAETRVHVVADGGEHDPDELAVLTDSVLEAIFEHAAESTIELIVVEGPAGSDQLRVDHPGQQPADTAASPSGSTASSRGERRSARTTDKKGGK